MRNEVVTINVKGIGEINVSATMKGECKGTKMFNLRHYVYTLRIWSKHGKMTSTFHDCAFNYPRVKKLDRAALLNALDGILSDISMYENDEIKWNYDDEDAAQMRQAEKSCKRKRDKFIEVVGGEEYLWTAIKSLTEQINR